MIVTASSKPDASNPLKDQLEQRAARFQLGTANPANSSTTQDKLAARAARFADVSKSTPVATNTGKGSTVAAAAKAALTSAYNPVDAEKLAKRAAKFADVLPAAKTDGKVTIANKPSIATSTAAPSAATSSVDKDVLAKRAARFANNPPAK